MQKILKNKYIILNDLHKLATCLFFRESCNNSSCIVIPIHTCFTFLD